MFKLNEKYKGSINKDVDIDIELIANYDIKEPGKCIQEIKDKPGLVRILKSCFPLPLSKYFQDFSQYIGHYTHKRQHLRGADNHLKLEFARTKVGALYHFVNRRMKFKTLEVKYIKELSKATVNRKFELHLDGEIYLSAAVDFSFMFKANDVPDVLQRFIERTRYSIPKEISSYIYVIAKTSHEEKHNMNTTEWTYSFSHIENHILTSLNDAHKLVYVIFKSIFSRSLKPLDEDRISSYIAKTIVFWRFENVTLVYDDWHNDTRIWENVEILFQDLSTYFKRGFLAHYFIPEVNILERFNNTLNEQCIQRIENVILPKLQTILNIKEISDAKDFIEEMISALLDVKELRSVRSQFDFHKIFDFS